MKQPEPGVLTIKDITDSIKNSTYLIPRFQREFVWTKEQSAKLIDSILHGYPIGSFIIWKTKERLKSVKKIGNLNLPNPPASDFVYYILDGQQRITSIFASVEGSIITRSNGAVDNFNQICIDLKADESDQIVYQDDDSLDKELSITLRDLLNLQMTEINDRFFDHPKYREIVNKIDVYRTRLNSYKFSKIELENTTIDVATDVFTRLNTSGKSLSAFEIMCAKMYDEDQNFDLLSKREEQRDNWKDAGYETVPDMTVLQAMCAVIKGTCSGKDILSLDRDCFIHEWDNVDAAFNKAIDWFQTAYGVAVSRLLPYDALLVPFVYFFRKHPTNPSGTQKKYLEDYFWRTVIGTRFTEGLVAKLAQDIERVINEILENRRPSYDHGVDITVENIKLKGGFSTGSAFSKGILCILCSKKPRSFETDVEVKVDNAWLSQGNSRNYHHFFPKAYMDKYHKEIDKALVNHIANITIVDSFLNKNQIKAKAPYKYIETFRNQNENIKETMKTHLIDLNKGIMDDDYMTFFNHRVELFQKEFKKRINLIPNLDIVNKSSE